MGRATNAFVVLMFLGLSGVVSASAIAQATEKQRMQLSQIDSTRVIAITTNDGSTFIGRIVAVRADAVDLQTSAGRVTIAFATMKPVTTVGTPGHEDWFENPNKTRLFFAPTGQMLKKGEGYFSDYEVLFPGVAYGLTDNISIGGGISLIPAGIDNQLFYVTPKVGVSLSPKLHVALGAIAAVVPGESNGSVGAIYGVGTAGDGEGSVTGGIAYGFAGRNLSSEFAVLLGGEKRLSRRIGLVTENYFVPSDIGKPVVSGGVRFMSEKLTVDLALFNLVTDPVFPGFPWLSFIYKF